MVLQIAPKLSRGCCVMPTRRLETVESIARGIAHYRRRPLSGWSIIVHIARHEITRVWGVSGMLLGERRIEFCDEHYGRAKRYASQWAACDWLGRAE
jgi:ABC-type phosphonate transport system ATPase subunit